MRKVTTTIAVLILLMCLNGFGAADSFGVLVPTSGLPSGQQFTLDFNLTDGSGAGDGNTSFIISNFSFDTGGAVVGTVVPFGTAAGDASTSVTMNDSLFSNEFQQMFTPGALLSFQVSFTGGVDAGSPPDLFTFSIDELNTADPSGALVELSFDSAHPNPNVFSATTFVTGGDAVKGVTPVITPEPGSMLLLGSGLSMIFAARRKRSA